MIRVLLIDDHSLVRTGFRLMLDSEVDIACVGEAATGEEGLALARQLKPDVVVCDLHLPGISGLEVTERLARSLPETRVMIVTVQEDGPLPRRLLNAGAFGYVAKACERGEFLRALRDVARGRRYLSAELAQRLALEPLDGPGESPFDQLSPRELEVVKLLCQGKRTGDIAVRLNLSPKTVSTHKYRLFDKLGIRDVVSLAKLAGSYGLIDG
jgi:two-component system, NarL family, invasion response regulator UvrY